MTYLNFLLFLCLLPVLVEERVGMKPKEKSNHGTLFIQTSFCGKDALKKCAFFL